MPAAATSDITATVRDSPSQRDDQPGQRGGDGRADGDAEQDQPEHARGDPQLGADLRDAGGPAGEDEPVADEGDVDGVLGAADLRFISAARRGLAPVVTNRGSPARWARCLPPGACGKSFTGPRALISSARAIPRWTQPGTVML